MKKIIGRKVGERRFELNLSRKWLAEKLDLSEGQIGRIECGESYPSIDTLIGLKNLLKTNFDYFFEELEDTLISNKDEQELFQIYKLLPKQSQVILREVARTLERLK